MRDVASVEALKVLLDQRKGGRGSVALHVRVNGSVNAEAVVSLPGAYKLEPALLSAIKAIQGVWDAQLDAN
jgi:hypothetical protein